MNRIINFSLIVLSAVFVVAYIAAYDDYLRLSLLLLFLAEMAYCVRDFSRNIVMILFLTAFFTFLMGRSIMPLFIDMDEYSEFFYTSSEYTAKTHRHVMLSLYLSLLFSFLAYRRIERKSWKKLKPKFNPESMYVKAIRNYSRIMTLVTSPFALLYVVEKIRFVLANGYAGFFMTYESALPLPFRILAALFEYMVFLFLATLPTKKQTKPIIYLYLFVSVLNIVAGDRGECMLAVFVVIFYYFLRNRLFRGETAWIGKKGIITLLIAAPFLVVFLFVMNFVRNDQDMNDRTVQLLISGFFFQQSTSMNVIASCYQDYDKLPHGKLYSLGPIMDYFRNNYLSRFVFGIEPYKVGTVELAKKGNSLDSALTYIEYPEFFANGGGMGSSFVAEAWYDFGYLGIILYSLFYGFVLASIPKWNSKNPWLSVIALIFLKYIMYAPRARATAFIASAASVSFWPVALVIYILSKKYVKNI